MKKTLLISGLLLALTASVASAGGVNLGWNNCSVAGVDNVNFACNINTGANVLYGTFAPNAGQMVAAFEFVIDLESAGAVLPEWWKLKTAGFCRSAGMSLNTNFAGGPFDCADPWAGNVGLQDFSYITPGVGGANTARISGGGALTAVMPVDAEVEYYGIALALNRQKTVGTGFCAGCPEPVCLVFNNMKLFNAVGAETDISTPHVRNYATWQGGQIGDPAGCPAATPTNKATWGRIKSIYR